MGLLYFTGKAYVHPVCTPAAALTFLLRDAHIRTIKAVFGMYLSKPQNPVGIKYEKHITSETATGASVPLSEFAK